MRTLAPRPIDDVLPALIAESRSGPVVLSAPTGAGKTTRVPPAISADLDSGQVVVIQPRRVAARATARFMAREQGWTLGREVGWRMRGDRKAGSKVMVVTDGTFLRWLQSDPFLEGVGAVIFDEFHERRTASDLALVLLRDAELDARLIVMSATLDVGRLSEWLHATPLASEGRSYPVEIRYAEREVEDLPSAMASAIARHSGPGNILCFLPGTRSIEETASLLTRHSVPLHGRLSSAEQDAALDPNGPQRVVLATNIAETSLTVPDVRVVIDSGLRKQQRFFPETGLERLELGWVSQASADQRAGRAGRTSDGICERLWSPRRTLVPFDPPEVTRTSFAPTLLELLLWGSDDLDWLDPPPEHLANNAAEVLALLGAIQGNQLTAKGRELANLHLPPRLAAVALAAARAGHPKLGLQLVDALEDAQSVFDLQPMLSRHTKRLLPRLPPPTSSHPAADALPIALLAGFPDRLGQRRGQGARLATGRGVRGEHLPELFVALQLTQGDQEAYARDVVPIRDDLIDWQKRRLTRFNPKTQRVETVSQVHHMAVVRHEHPSPLDLAEVRPILREHALPQIEQLLPDGFRPLQARLASLGLWLEDWPEHNEAFWAEVFDHLPGSPRSFGDLRKAEWTTAVWSTLGFHRRAELNRLAPSEIRAPRARRPIRLRYSADGSPPVLAAKMQLLFGLHQTPTVARGAMKCVVHLLAPNGRPQQITSDLGGFWTRTWPEVRKELRARYPKHAWPENPHEDPR